MKAEKRDEDTQQPIVDSERYDRNKKLIAVIMARFFLRYLNLLYRDFEGDLVLPIVLGEIAHHNIIRLYSLKGGGMQVNEQADNYPEQREYLEPTNAYSISQATGIPRETVRRKIKKLQQKGWVVKNNRGEVCISDTVSEHFAKDLNKRILAELLETSESIRSLLNPPKNQEQ